MLFEPWVKTESFKYMVLIPLLYGDTTMKNKNVVIIRFLIERKNEELNILKISKELRMDYKNVYSIIKRLEKKHSSNWSLLGSPAGLS